MVGGGLTVLEPKHQALVRLTHSHPDCPASGQINGGERVLQSQTMRVLHQKDPCLPGEMPAGDLHNGDEHRHCDSDGPVGSAVG